ncbi:MAG: aspartate--ammonia ligase [Flavobacteriales bacterium]|nr:aspartate--ammonia ligase [Flavobacteriales bacterium]
MDIRRSLKEDRLILESKQIFEDELRDRLNLTKTSAPLFVAKSSGLNDNLNGVEKPVSFQLNSVDQEIVHSLAKWKRWYLGIVKAEIGEGIVTDMKAIRADEVISDIHSNLVDQWDWEKVITKDQRSLSTLIEHGQEVFNALKSAEKYTSLKSNSYTSLPDKLKIIHTEELYRKYPELPAKDRENAISKQFGAVLLIGIGGKLSNGEIHDLRAPDYDDWSTKNEDGFMGMNADLIVWDSIQESSLEISSMGIRVDKNALETQLKLTNQEKRKELPFHKALLSGKLPYTIGGGIGQSRVAMFVNKKKRISDVQAIY